MGDRVTSIYRNIIRRVCVQTASSGTLFAESVTQYYMSARRKLTIRVKDCRDFIAVQGSAHFYSLVLQYSSIACPQRSVH